MKWPSICKRLMYTTCTLKLHVSHWYDMVKLVVPSRENVSRFRKWSCKYGELTCREVP